MLKQQQLADLTNQVLQKRLYYSNLESETRDATILLDSARAEKIEKENEIAAARAQLEGISAAKEEKLSEIKRLKAEEASVIDRRNNFYPEFEKKILDQYLQLKGNIRVFVRVRPILPADFKAYEGSKDSFEHLEQQLKLRENQQQLELELQQSGKIAKHQFNFDFVFGKQSS